MRASDLSGSRAGYVKKRTLLRYYFYYFRFLKTSSLYIEILLPASTLTLLSSSACDSASAHQISSKSDYTRPSYDVIAIFKMAAVSHVRFAVGYGRPPTKCSWWLLLCPQILPLSLSDLQFRR